MERDGYCTSIWQHNIQPYKPAVNQLPSEIMGVVDVVIAGGGITGITTGLELQLAGKTCVIMEAHNIGFGTSGGTSSHLNTMMDSPYDEIESNFGEKGAQMVGKIALQSIKKIEQYMSKYTIECGYKKLPGYLLAQDEKQANELDKIVEGTKKAGVPVDFAPNVPIPIPYIRAAVFEGQGQIHATEYLYGLARAFEKEGGRIITDCRVTGAKEDEGDEKILTIETSQGTIRARHLVYATHIPPGVNILHFRCAPYRSYILGIRLRDDNYPDGMMYDLQDPYHYYRTQEIDGQKYLLAGGEDHKTAHEENTAIRFTKLESYVRQIYNVDTVPYKWSSQYFESVDGLPYIGHLPGNPDNVYVATGFGGNGMIYGTAAATILTGLIVEGESEYKSLFSPARVKPIAGFENFIKEAADVTGMMIGKWAQVSKIQGPVELAKGEAKVVKYGDESVALYKDDNGKLHAVSPACPHIKCAVGWNNAEKSWDCPCHGSRFSYTGELLSGPARRDLDKVELKDN